MPALEKTMGLPFDFATLKPRPDQPEAFDIKDYLTIGSVVNTVYSLFDVPKANYRSLRRDLAGRSGPARPARLAARPS